MTRAPFRPDPKSLVGKLPAPEEHAHIVVIGAGPAGIAAAIEAASHGAAVKLIDENPIAAELLGLDVPLFFGQRATGAVQAKDRMLEQIFSASPRLEEAFDAGVEVMLGVYAWGAFLNGANMQTLPGPVVGLADETRSWLVGFDRLILATGARDLVFFFEGADQPGVMGAQALQTLLQRYDAFSGQRIVFLGSGDLAIASAHLALDRGVQVAALIEVRDAPQCSPEAAAALRVRDVNILCGHVMKTAERGPFGVAGAVVAATASGIERRFDCDTICLAVDRVPMVDLADVVGARLEFQPARGGYVPIMPDATTTVLANVFVAGDCAGLKTVEAAEAEGRAAARAALRSLGREVMFETAIPAAVPTDLAYRTDWMRALLAVGSPEVLACQCEEVTRGELFGVKPPRYLGSEAPKLETRDLQTLALDGPINQDQIKRITRACMGACQARRCREQIAMMLAIGAGVPLGKVPLAGYRAPVRPLPLGVLNDTGETAEMRADWDVWFGIPTQWVPYADIGTDREAEFLGGNMHL